MKIEHTAAYFRDLEAAKDFFVRFFGAESSDQYHNRKTGFQSYFLRFEGDTRLELMSRPDIPDEKRDHPGYGYSHIAFSVGSRQKVDELTEELSQNGYNVLSDPRFTGDGYYESCISGPEGIQIELTL